MTIIMDETKMRGGQWYHLPLVFTKIIILDGVVSAKMCIKFATYLHQKSASRALNICSAFVLMFLTKFFQIAPLKCSIMMASISWIKSALNLHLSCSKKVQIWYKLLSKQYRYCLVGWTMNMFLSSLIFFIGL